jgi:hypothetical protein
MEVPCCGGGNFILALELRYDVKDSPAIAHRMGFEDMVAVKEPISFCFVVWEPVWNRGGVFRCHGGRPSEA